MLLDLLRKLPPAGNGSLEYLVGQVMSAVFVMGNRPEGSGYQAGRDIYLFDLETGQRTGIEIEVKRYGEGSGPSERDLVGEAVQQQSNRPNVHLWILVSTARVTARKTEELQKVFERGGTEFKLVDAGAEGLGYLEVMIAIHADVSLAWVGQTRPADLGAWTTAIARVKSHPTFAIHREAFAKYIHGRFFPVNARKAAQAWLSKHMDGISKPVPRLNQFIGRSDRAPAIPRLRIETKARAWLEGSSESTRLLAFLGEEGDGKTWSALDLLRTAQDRTPLLATANMLDDGGATSLLAKALANQCGGDEDDWRDLVGKKQERWFADLNILLVVDGLNEAPKYHFSSVLSELLEGPWGPHLNVIVTCRKAFWATRVKSFLYTRTSNIDTISVGPFDLEEEWPKARRLLGPGISVFPNSLLTALRNPRLWSFAYDLRDHLGGLGEITLERLLIEHWRLRIQQRSRLELTAQQFNRLIAKAVAGVGPGLRSNRLFEEGDLKSLLGQIGAEAGSFNALLGEISDGVFFVSTSQEKLKLRPERILVALGLLLAQEMMDALDCDAFPEKAREVAGGFLHDLPAKEELEVIIRSAILVFLTQSDYRSLALPPLLRQWVGLQNTSEDFDRALSIVAAASPEDLLQAVEDEASEDEYVAEAAEKLVTALIGRRDQPAAYSAMLDAATMWLSSYSADLHPELDSRSADGLIPTHVLSVEDLYNHAAHLMAHLKVEDWHIPLAGWARRETAITQLNGRAPALEIDIRWLGMSDGLTDTDAASIIARLGSISDQNTETQVQLVADLLNGNVFERRKRKNETTVADVFSGGETPSQSRSQVHYSDAYPQVPSQARDAWSAIEANLVTEGPESLLAKIEEFREELDSTLEAGRPIASVAQFINDNALVLSDFSVNLVRRHLRNRTASHHLRDGSLFPPGSALPAVFVAIDPGAHVKIFLELAGLAGASIEVLNLAGLSPHLDAEALSLLSEAMNGEGALQIAAMEALARSSEDVEIPQEVVSNLVTIALSPKSLRQARALRVLNSRGTKLSFRAIAASNLSACDAYGILGPNDLSSLIISGTERPVYSCLRQRVSLQTLARAATADGSPEAFADFAKDFAALLERTGDCDSVPWEASADFDGLPLNRAQPIEKSVAVDASLNPFVLDGAQVAEALEAVSIARPAAVEELSKWIDCLTDANLVSLESRIGLITGLGARADAQSTRRWVRRLFTPVTRVSEIDPREGATLYALAFDSNRSDFDQLRDDLAERAWSDGELCDLCTVAEFGNCNEWLDRWITSEGCSKRRTSRVRAIIMRGWRASGEDRKVLNAGGWQTGYESYAAELSRSRAASRKRMEDLLEVYRSAASDGEAWYAYRQLIHFADRRLGMLTRSPDWRKALSRSRRAYHEVMSTEFEWFVRRNEGGLTGAFANVRVPASIPPWTRIDLYSGSLGD